MVPALPPFSLRAIPSTSLTIVRGGHFGLAGHHFIGWLPIPTAESFIQSGAGDHSIDPPNHFAYADADDTPEDLHATVEGIAEVKLSGPLAAPGRVHGKRLIHPHYEDCTRGGVNDIRRAIWDAATDLRHAYVGVKYIEGHHTDEWAVMYERWFGTYSKVGRDTVKKIIDYMWGKIRFASSTFVCRTGEDAGIPAKLFPKKRIEVYRGFKDSTNAARTDTLLRLAGNRSRHIKNVAVGVGAARELALSGSKDVYFNYDNYDAFIQNRPDPIPQSAAALPARAN